MMKKKKKRLETIEAGGCESVRFFESSLVALEKQWEFNSEEKSVADRGLNMRSSSSAWATGKLRGWKELVKEMKY